MEMQQIRYFLALAETLNFTRAAEECNVSQPALTRAIQALEGELGGDLLRREGRHSHLTELGKRMLPLLQRCYESALTARELARAVTKNEVAPLSIGVSNTVNLELFMPPVSELFRTFPGLQLRIQHGPAARLLDELKGGDFDLAIASAVDDGWERLDRWALYSEGFEIAIPASHPLARHNTLAFADLLRQSLLRQTGCEDRAAVERWFAERGGALAAAHEYDSQHDLKALLQASAAVAIVPETAPQLSDVKRSPLEGLDVRRTVHVYAVAGRLRSPAAAAFLNLVRSADYSAVA
ncbi:MAG: LysR family transcriptional regulator [Parvularculaceae bacterium]